MKTFVWSVILQLLLALFTRGDIKVTSVEQPPPGQIVERSIVTMLRFQVIGDNATLNRVIFHREGPEGNGLFGEFILVSEEDGLVRARTTIDSDGFVRFNLGDRYTGERSITYAVRLRALPFLKQYGFNEVSLKLTSIEVEGGILVGNFPIVGPKFTINPNPIIGNVLLYPEKRKSTNELLVNVAGQELGRFRTDVWQIEPTVVSSLVFYTQSLNHSDSFGTITSVTIEDEKGQVVAGPVDAKSWGEAADQQIIRFNDTVALPMGRSVYTIRGKLSAKGFNHNSLVGIHVATSEWKFVGASSGYEFEAWSRDFSLDFTPVNTGWVFVVLDPNGGNINVPVGSKQVQLATLDWLTYGSAEDLLLKQVRLCFAGKSAAQSVDNVQIYLGDAPLNRMDVRNVPDSGDMTITLDEPFLIAKSSEVELSIRADISSDAEPGAGFHVEICGLSSDGFEFTGVTTGTPPYVHVPIQFGVGVVIEDSKNFPRIDQLAFLRDERGLTVNMLGAAMPNTDYELEASTDLVEWQVVGGLKQGPYAAVKEPAIGLLPYGNQYAGQAFFRLKQKQ